jgi:hypothetical protein
LIESLIPPLRRTPPAPAPAYCVPPGERLAGAGAFLAFGKSNRARPLLEIADAQLLRIADAQLLLQDALRWLSAGQPARALSPVNAAIAALDQVGRSARRPAQPEVSGPGAGAGDHADVE